MRILSVETSCDETAISIIEANKTESNIDFTILANQVVSQIDIHKEFGGVFPIVAKREHGKALVPVLKKILEKAEMGIQNTSTSPLLSQARDKCSLTSPVHEREQMHEYLSREPELLEQFIPYISSIAKPDIDLIAVTTGPGLAPALWVGVSFARALAVAWDIPVIGVNHMEGHILSSIVPKDANSFSIPEIKFPSLSLLVSGGHTEIILVKDWMNYEKIGQTVDDAVGEAFDKCARMLDLPYPGGPEISRLAEIARNENLSDDRIKFPRPMINTPDYNFSYSGLKTSVLYKIQELGSLDDKTKQVVALEFENAAIEVLVKKVERAIDEYHIENLIIGGGVANNKHLQREINIKLENKVNKIFWPRLDTSTDNSIMIGLVGALHYLSNGKTDNPETLSANANWEL